jgi:hypothetical protein
MLMPRADERACYARDAPFFSHAIIDYAISIDAIDFSIMPLCRHFHIYIIAITLIFISPITPHFHFAISPLFSCRRLLII